MTQFKTEKIPAYVVWAMAPEADFEGEGDSDIKFEDGTVFKPVDIEMNKEDSDVYVMRGVHAAFSTFLGHLKPGGTIAVTVFRAPDETEQDGPATTGSFVLSNPDGKRHVWDYAVEKRQAVNG